ncbi:MAG: hypothetical protein ACK4E8_07600 [Lacibacter sp.]|jgi:hypothetical protein
MELEQLKELWKEEPVFSPEVRIEELLRQRSRSTISKMKRNLKIELLLLVVVYAGMVWYYFQKFERGMLAIVIMLLAILLFFLWYYYKKMNLLRQMECVVCEVKSNLQQQLQQLKSYVRFYVKAGTCLFPLAMVFTALNVIFNRPPGTPNPILENTRSFLVFLAVLAGIALVLTIPVYYINKWYVCWLYGQHVDKLQNIVNEISETEAPASNS